jgi:phosphoserine phosphatase
MLIFLDLDETLIHSIAVEEQKLKNYDISHFELFDFEDVLVVLRPEAKEIIDTCREIGETIIMTTGTADYMAAINEHFGFGFEKERLFCRELFSFNRKTYPRSQFLLTIFPGRPTQYR